MKTILLCWVALATLTTTLAQTKLPKTYAFKAMAKNKQDSVILRWQASDEILWKVASRVGYTIERYTISPDSAQRWARKQWDIKPWTEEEWHQKMPADTMGAVLATLAFGKETPLTDKTTLYGQLLKKHENDNRFFLATLLASYNPRQAQLMGYRLVDNTVERNKKYLYRIYAPTASFNLTSDTALVYIETSQPEPEPRLAPLTKEEGDKFIRLKWNRTYSDTYFVGYYPERSDDNGRTFRRVTNRPFFQVFSGSEKEDADRYVFTDSIPRNYKTYQYRLRGITAFGELTTPSPIIEAMGRDRVPPSTVTSLKALNTIGSAVQLTWVKAVQEGDLAGFVVSKGEEASGPFKPLNTKLLPVSTAQFTDPTANEFARNYYVVSAVDTAGNAATTLPVYVAMLDRGAPGKPTSLTGSIDSTGHVTINWKRNPEPDLLGYMVYVANAPDQAFTPLTPDFLADETYHDSITLRTLSEKIYYRIVAFDKSRRASPYSDILTLKKPDRIAPVKPVFDRFLVADSSVSLHWVRSSSDDVVEQLLYRKEIGKDTDYNLLTRFDKAKADYVDRTLVPRHDYQYALVAVDDSKNRSELSFPQRVRPYDSGVRKGIQNLTIAARAGQPIQLKWTSVNANCRILIYRKVDEQPLQLLDSVPGAQQSFADKPTGKGVYQYALKTIYKDGGESLLTPFQKATVN